MTNRKPKPQNEPLTASELAWELKRSTKYVYRMKSRGFQMPGGRATVAEARSWLAVNPPPFSENNAEVSDPAMRENHPVGEDTSPLRIDYDQWFKKQRRRELAEEASLKDYELVEREVFWQFGENWEKLFVPEILENLGSHWTNPLPSFEEFLDEKLNESLKPKNHTSWNRQYAKIVHAILTQDSDFFHSLADHLEAVKTQNVRHSKQNPAKSLDVLKRTIVSMLYDNPEREITTNEVREALPLWAQKKISSDDTIRQQIKELGKLKSCRGRPKE